MAKMDRKPFDAIEFGDPNLCNKRCCWWSSSQDSYIYTFCNESSIHGFRFLDNKNRPFTERIFWLIAFLLSLIGAVYLIYGLWERYQRLPLIVTFQSSEQDIDSIPFPAVTFCNMNRFPITKVRELQKIAKSPLHAKNKEAILQLKFVRSICDSQQSIAKDFGFAINRGTSENRSANDTISEDKQVEMMDFLFANTIPCDEFIRHCMLGEEQQDCSKLFKPIITDYGKCCTFNILPIPLLLKNPQTFGRENSSIYDNPVLGSYGKINWPETDLNEWKNWKYEDGLVLESKLTKPWRQKRAGLPYGLSILVDPNTDEYYCPASDSEDLNKEILIEVHPDMTNADESIRFIEHEKRQCYFESDKKLKFFGPYTGGNCMDDCTAIVLGESCSCSFMHIPRDDGVGICNNKPESTDYNCIERTRIEFQATLRDKCKHCDPTCEDIAYNYETTTAELQNAKKLWFDQNPLLYGNTPPKWAHHKMSIIHIFYKKQTTVPKLRKLLYGKFDLIANTGGILGLCLGFSILSGVEILYFLILRPLLRFCRRITPSRKVLSKIVKVFRSRKPKKVIRVNPRNIPLYANSGYPHM